MSAFAAFALDLATHLLSPYQLNPLGLNPLRELLTEVVDFRLIRQQCMLPLMIAATEVRTGRCRIFREHELTADMVLASACLPRLHHGVEIGGSLFWDGGFSSNPPLMALAELARSPTLLLLRINPLEAHRMPHRAAAIRNRTAEIIECTHKALFLQNLYDEEDRRPLEFLRGKYIAAISGIARC